MTIPRQLTPTVGLARGGDEFLEGFLPGIEKFAVFRMKNNQFERICISIKFISYGFTICEDFELKRRLGLRVVLLMNVTRRSIEFEDKSISVTVAM